MTWAIPLAMVLIAVCLFWLTAILAERPARREKDWGQAIGQLPTAPWDGQTFEHPGASYNGTGRHRRT